MCPLGLSVQVGTTAAGSDSCWLNYLTGDAKTHTAPKHPRNVRFTVCPPFRFKERQRLADAEENWLADPGLYTKEQMAELRIEASRDEADFERLRGNVVTFGQRVSLLQNHTGKMMSFTNAAAAIDGIESSDSKSKADILTQTEVAVTAEPGSGNVMKIMPGFRFRQVGRPPPLPPSPSPLPVLFLLSSLCLCPPCLLSPLLSHPSIALSSLLSLFSHTRALSLSYPFPPLPPLLSSPLILSPSPSAPRSSSPSRNTSLPKWRERQQNDGHPHCRRSGTHCGTGT